jgi:hypothetical protein
MSFLGDKFLRDTLGSMGGAQPAEWKLDWLVANLACRCEPPLDLHVIPRSISVSAPELEQGAKLYCSLSITFSTCNSTRRLNPRQ